MAADHSHLDGGANVLKQASSLAAQSRNLLNTLRLQGCQLGGASPERGGVLDHSLAALLRRLGRHLHASGHVGDLVLNGGALGLELVTLSVRSVAGAGEHLLEVPTERFKGSRARLVRGAHCIPHARKVHLRVVHELLNRRLAVHRKACRCLGTLEPTV